ncbi:MAG: Ig-like domain-containing protein [Prevotella sp.]|nr:Ig-like domain-containing protein [Prevotella sp.]
MTNTVAYCLPTAGDPQAKGLYLSMNGGAFEDYSAQFGASAHQIVVSNVSLPDHQISLERMSSKNTVVSSSNTTTVFFDGYGKKQVQSFDYTIDVAGTKTTKHQVLPSPVPPGFGMSGSFEVEYQSPAEVGTYRVEVTLNKVNGVAVSEATHVSATMQNLSKAVARRTVVEEFTGTGCGWCPRGWVGMEKLKRDYPETFIGIAFHKYNTSDPMYVANYYSTQALGISGAPGCNMNRRMEMDPYYGTYNGIWNDFEAFNAELPAVDVSLTATWNSDKTAVDIKTSVEPLTKDLGFTVAYVLTADNLSGTTSAWKQANYYASNYTKSQFPDDPELAEFARGGSKGQSSVALTFNDVMIGSSYNNSGKNLATAIPGADQAQLGTVYQGNYSVAMPTKATLKEAIQLNKVFANVLVISNATGEILNAARVAITEKDTPDPVDPELSFSETAFEVEEGSDFTAPTLNNPNNVTVTYTSSDAAVAQVDENTGAVTIGAPGTTTITASFAGNDEYLPASASYTITVTEKQAPFVTEINVEREVGQGYDVTRFEPDFTEALAYLGIENPTDATLVGINADGSEEAAPNGPIDGWCDADGNFIGWGKEETRICVKFFPAVPQYEICDMNGADEVGKTYTVKYGLKANDKMAIFVINVTFIEKQEHIYKPEIVKTIEISHLEKAATAYCEEEPAPTFDVAEVCAALGIADMSEAKAYIVNLTDGNFVENTGTIDGWRNADGDAAPWAQCANGFCLKLNNPASGEFDYTGAHDANFQVGDTYVAQWGIVANEKAVLLKVTITFVDDPTGINGINADAKADIIYNMNGVRTKNMNQKGVYIHNGKKVLVK